MSECPIPETPRYLTYAQLWILRTQASSVVARVAGKDDATLGEKQLAELCLRIATLIVIPETKEEPDGPMPHRMLEGRH